MAKKKPLFEKRQDNEMDALLPFMSLLLIIIPMLLSNMAFHHFLKLEASTPGVSDESSSDASPEQNKEKNVMAQIFIDDKKIEAEVLDEETAESIKKINVAADAKGAKESFELFKSFKEKYPKLDTVLVTTFQDVPYETLLIIMNELKLPVERKVASESKIEKSTFNLVLLPMALERISSATGKQ